MRTTFHLLDLLPVDAVAPAGVSALPGPSPALSMAAQAAATAAAAAATVEAVVAPGRDPTYRPEVLSRAALDELTAESLGGDYVCVGDEGQVLRASGALVEGFLRRIPASTAFDVSSGWLPPMWVNAARKSVAPVLSRHFLVLRANGGLGGARLGGDVVQPAGTAGLAPSPEQPTAGAKRGRDAGVAGADASDDEPSQAESAVSEGELALI